MKNSNCKRNGNPYATNKGGRIEAPNNPGRDDPRASSTVSRDGRDLRSPGAGTKKSK